MLAALTAASIGIAVPTLVERISDEMYPCMNCPCGCASAEACWRDCCCFTHQQKLAWAEEKGVVPPKFVVASARAEAELPPCCRKRMASCCKNMKKSCCQQGSEDENSLARNAEQDRKTRSGTRKVALLDVLRCQGIGMHWTMLPPCVMPSLPNAADFPAGLSEQIIIADCFFSGQLSPPELPPPQHSV